MIHRTNNCQVTEHGTWKNFELHASMEACYFFSTQLYSFRISNEQHHFTFIVVDKQERTLDNLLLRCIKFENERLHVLHFQKIMIIN